MTHPPGTQSQYRRTPLSSEEKARGEANLAPFVAQMLVARGRFRVSADTPDQVELFQGVARRVSDMLQRPVASYANGREIVITFGQQEAPALALRSPGWALPARLLPRSQPAIRMARTIPLAIAVATVDHPPGEKRDGRNGEEDENGQSVVFTAKATRKATAAARS